MFFFFKQKTAYEMRISDWSSDVCSSDLDPAKLSHYFTTGGAKGRLETGATVTWDFHDFPGAFPVWVIEVVEDEKIVLEWQASEGEPHNVEGGEQKNSDYRTKVTMSLKALDDGRTLVEIAEEGWRSEEQTSESQELMRNSYDVFCRKK